MATLLLAAAGSALGGALGGVGAVVGQAVGAVAGAVIDHALLRTARTVTGSRLSDLDVQTSTEGEAIPRLYGRARIAEFGSVPDWLERNGDLLARHLGQLGQLWHQRMARRPSRPATRASDPRSATAS